MGKHTNKEAYFKRLQELAQVDKKSVINERNNRTLGTLIDFKTAADGYTYGIVKENHNYYIKKSNKSKNPNVADFAYIGGLENITNYQYNKLSEADKNRNMIINTISEAYSHQQFKTTSKTQSNKKMLIENVDEDANTEIAQAKNKLSDLESATTAQTEPMSPMPDIDSEETPDFDNMELGDDETPTEEPVGDDETPTEEPVGDDTDLTPEDQDSLVSKEIEKGIGKLTHRIRKTSLTNEQTSSYLKQLISAFKDGLKDLEIEERKEIADKILKIVPQEDIDDLDVSGEDDSELPITAEAIEDDECGECGSFVQYAESRGYTNENILDATNEEIANLAAGYINANKEGMNEGDFESVGTHLTPESYNILKEEYGFDDDDLADYQQNLNENNDDQRIERINEFWGGLKNLAKDAGQGVAKGAQQVGQGIAKGAQQVGQGIAKGVQQVGQGAQQVGQGVKQSYYKGEVNPHVDKIEKIANKLQQSLNDYNSVLRKAGQEPVQINDLLADIFGGIGTPSAPLTKSGKEMTPQQKTAWERGKNARPAGISLKQYRNENDEIDENLDDPAKIEVQPTFAQESQTLGVVMKESEEKIRKYVRTRLEEKMGLRKIKLSESVKTNKIKKLDSMIDEQLNLYKKIMNRK